LFKYNGLNIADGNVYFKMENTMHIVYHPPIMAQNNIFIIFYNII